MEEDAGPAAIACVSATAIQGLNSHNSPQVNGDGDRSPRGSSAGGLARRVIAGDFVPVLVYQRELVE